MNVNSNERGVVSVLLIVLVVLLVTVLGVAAYNYSKSHSASQPTPTPLVSSKPTPSPTPTVSSSPVSAADEASILAAASTQCNTAAKAYGTTNGATLDRTPDIIGDAAKVGVHCVGYESGQVDILVNTNGTWTIIYTGQQPPSKAIGQKYSLPTSWYQPN